MWNRLAAVEFLRNLPPTPQLLCPRNHDLGKLTQSLLQPRQQMRYALRRSTRLLVEDALATKLNTIASEEFPDNVGFPPRVVEVDNVRLPSIPQSGAGAV
jgi:hypothetical protein